MERLEQDWKDTKAFNTLYDLAVVQGKILFGARMRMRIPVKLVTGSGAKLDSDSGQTGHRSERSDAGVGL